MGPINWLAIVLCANLAIAVGIVWYGPLFGGASLFGRLSGDEGKGSGILSGIFGVVLLQGLSALMLAHNFARIGADTLAEKPQLYWMQSGGIALAFVVPALWISYAHQRVSRREALVDGGFWVVTYLAMGTVFWALR